MPTLKRRPRQRNALNFWERFCLQAGGFQENGCNGTPPYCNASLEEHRERYLEFRDELIEWQRERQPGRRPEAYWTFEPRVPARLRWLESHWPVDLSVHDEYELERAAWLAATGRASDDEIAAALDDLGSLGKTAAIVAAGVKLGLERRRRGR